MLHGDWQRMSLPTTDTGRSSSMCARPAAWSAITWSPKTRPLGKEAATDPVGLGSYHMDSHAIKYFVSPEGFLSSEGGMFVTVPAPFGISYRSIIPKKGECENLLVPVCSSATHAAYGSIRMEPVFMVLGQSPAATAATLAIDRDLAVQDVPYSAFEGTPPWRTGRSSIGRGQRKNDAR